MILNICFEWLVFNLGLPDCIFWKWKPFLSSAQAQSVALAYPTLLGNFPTLVSCSSTALQWGTQLMARGGSPRIHCEQPWFYLVDQDFLKITSIFFLKFASNFSTKLQLYHKPPDLDEVSNCWLFEPNSLFATVCNHRPGIVRERASNARGRFS